MSLTFNFDPWDNKKDLLMEKVGNSFATTLVREGIEVSHVGTLQNERRNQTSEAAVDGIAHILAASIEWLRWYGITEADVQSRVTKHLNAERQSTRGQFRLALGGTKDTSGALREGTKLSEKDVSAHR